jgi:hypothetical protein
MFQIWYNDMSYKDRDDCGKRLLCELNAKARFFQTKPSDENSAVWKLLSKNRRNTDKSS